MPELPEVETVMRGLAPVLANRMITKITLNRPDLRIPFPSNMCDMINDQRCIGLRRRGKYIWMDMENGQTLVIHLGMSGSFTINPSHPKKHDHVIIETDHNDCIAYHDPRRFGMMFIVRTGQEHDHPAFRNMGAEPFSNDFNAHTLSQKLQNKKIPIKSALLDQSILAGIGNIYACEALYEANISPLRPAYDIKNDELENLVTAIRDVLMSAIQSGGSTLRDHRQADGTMGYFQHSFKVYDREGDLCPETGDKIIRIIQSGRSTFYSPMKQR